MVKPLDLCSLPTFVVVSRAEPQRCRQLSFLQGRVDEAFFEPLPDEELERWG
jgi:hypothetical protein